MGHRASGHAFRVHLSSSVFISSMQSVQWCFPSVHLYGSLCLNLFPHPSHSPFCSFPHITQVPVLGFISLIAFISPAFDLSNSFRLCVPAFFCRKAHNIYYTAMRFGMRVFRMLPHIQRICIVVYLPQMGCIAASLTSFYPAPDVIRYFVFFQHLDCFFPFFCRSAAFRYDDLPFFHFIHLTTFFQRIRLPHRSRGISLCISHSPAHEDIVH